MRRFVWLAVLATILGAVAAAAAPATVAPAQRETALEQGILREVNRVRSDRGLRPLLAARGLQAAAAFQSKALLTQGVFEHDSLAGGALGERLRRFYPVGSARSWSVGENLLWSVDGIDAGSAVKLWLDSPVHRKIMLDPTWREFGAGAVASPSAPGIFSSAGAVVVVTIDFGTRTGATRTAASARA
jgi:uncharacterized protein YkwD